MTRDNTHFSRSTMKHINDFRRGLRALVITLLAFGFALTGNPMAHAQDWWDHPYWPNAASVPTTGRPVPALAWLDEDMREFMQARSIPGGVMGIMRDGDIVYSRGFGHDYNKLSMPENTPLRLASVSKTITVAAARHLISTGALDLDDFAFDRGQTVQVGQFQIIVGGILPSPKYAPFGTPADNIEDITVSHLIHHRSGWYAGSHTAHMDFAFHDKDCAVAMGVASPPGATNKIRWIQGKPLAFVPGAGPQYSNINTLILSAVVEHVSGMELVDYVHTYVMRPAIGIPATEVFRGRTFREHQSPREPYYKTLNAKPSLATGPWIAPTVFDNYGPANVEVPYGGGDVEASAPFGSMVASPAAMLIFADHYDLRYSTDEASTFGMPLTGPLPWPSGHTGSLDGYESIIFQEDTANNGAFRYFVAFNARSNSADFFPGHWPAVFLNAARPALVAMDWSTTTATSDGFWTRPGIELNFGVGGYNAPFWGFQRMLDKTTEGSKIRLMNGSQNWTGVIDRAMVLDAPLGEVTLGQ